MKDRSLNSEVSATPFHARNLDALCGQRHVAHHHVLDHALAERGHLLRGHELTPYEIAAHAAVAIVLS